LIIPLPSRLSAFRNVVPWPFGESWLLKGYASPVRSLEPPCASGFLAALDRLVDRKVQLHCCGGFVVTVCHGLERTTADLDVLLILPHEDQRRLAALAGWDSGLHKTHGVYLDVVTVATYPDSYEDRLTDIFPGMFRHIQLLALDPYTSSNGTRTAIVVTSRTLGRARDAAGAFDHSIRPKAFPLLSRSSE
jgi:hypothetical protein